MFSQTGKKESIIAETYQGPRDSSGVHKEGIVGTAVADKLKSHGQIWTEINYK